MNDSQFWIIIGVTIILFVITWLLLFNPFHKFRAIFKKKTLAEEKIAIIQNIIIALDNLSNIKRGATIILDDIDETNDYIADYEYLNAEVTSNLITNIFEGVNTPLHDGAIVINNGKMKSASAFISKLSNKKVPSQFGTRHRSALGLSEVTGAVIIVLSEETKNIHIFYKGKFEKINKSNLFEKIYEKWVK